MSQPAGPAATRSRETAYLVVCKDSAEAAQLRLRHMNAHLAHIEGHLPRYLVAGPALDAHDQINASVLVLRADSEAHARALVEADPYFRAGVWQSIDIVRFRAVCGDAIGGITWAPVLAAQPEQERSR